MFHQDEKQKILSNFPNIKLSYGNITHKKVCDADFVVAIPKGIKCFAWFTKYNSKNVCFIMELSENKEVKNIKIMECSFNSDLSNGTIFYGTFFIYSKNNFFTIEDIFFYKGKFISSFKWVHKLDIIKQIMENDIKQERNNIIFGLPIMDTNYENLVKEIRLINYNIYCFHFKYYNKLNNFILPVKYIDEINTFNINNKNKNINKNIHNKNNLKEFIVKPDIQNDIYYLYTDNSNNEIFDIAYIPDYKTSVMMNTLFRDIKENRNLDYLEESDDEEEFQNKKEDKFVFLDRSYNMICQYNHKFKKWYPIKVKE